VVLNIKFEYNESNDGCAEFMPMFGAGPAGLRNPAKYVAWSVYYSVAGALYEHGAQGVHVTP
jgi:hypothetical protein